MSDVYAADLQQGELVKAADVREVQNYRSAHQLGLKSELPLSLRLIRNLHGQLMKGVRGQERHPGEFRTYQNFIGAPTGADATYVPPPVPEMRELLDDLERFLNEQALRPLVQAAVAHYQFEAIHPFGDGNGRVGRLLIPLFLRDRELLLSRCSTSLRTSSAAARSTTNDFCGSVRTVIGMAGFVTS